jgi:hypothetical protein
MLSKGFVWRAGLFTIIATGFALFEAPPARAQAPADSPIRLEWRVESESEYHHLYTNGVLVQGMRKLVFQPPAGWVAQLKAEEQKAIFQPVAAGEWITLQLVATNDLVFKNHGGGKAAKTGDAPTDAAAAADPAKGNAATGSGVSAINPEVLEGWFKASLFSTNVSMAPLRTVHANGLEGVVTDVRFQDQGRLRVCQVACVDLYTNFVVISHVLPGSNQTSMHLNGMLNSLSLETNVPGR